MPLMAFRMYDLNRLLFYCMGGTLVAPSYNAKGKKSYKGKTKHVINTSAQFVTLNNNNKFYTLLNQIY